MNEDLRYIASIAEHGSISAAARAEHISQPALSQRLRRFEAKLGAELFDRSTSPLVPTETGAVVVRYALRAIAAESNMRREIINTLNRRSSRLVVGIAMARANAMLSEPIMEFYETYHNCTIELRDMATLDQMHSCFLKDEIDFALFTPIMPDPEAYEVEVLCRERLVVVAAKNLNAPQLKRAHANSIALERLEGMPFVLPTCGAYFDPVISHIIDNTHAQLDIVLRGCDAELALALIGNGLGVAIVPSSYVIGRSGLNVFEIDGIGASNTLRYVRKRSEAQSLEEARFLQIVKNWIARQRLQL